MAMSDVKEKEVVNRITKMADKLHFSGDWSSISGMKVPAEVTNWSWRTAESRTAGNISSKHEVQSPDWFQVNLPESICQHQSCLM